MTNGDKFRSMTNEELAFYMYENIACVFCPVATETCAKHKGICIATWMDYLARESEQKPELLNKSFRFSSMLCFSQRLMLERAFENWCRANGAAVTPMNMVAFIQDMQLIKIEDTHLYLKDKQGLKTDDWKKAGF